MTQVHQNELEFSASYNWNFLHVSHEKKKRSTSYGPWGYNLAPVSQVYKAMKIDVYRGCISIQN